MHLISIETSHNAQFESLHLTQNRFTESLNKLETENDRRLVLIDEML